MRYVAGIGTIPNTDPDNALILGTALHTGIEEGVEQALDFYQNSFPVLTDDHINEMIKLEAMIPKAKAMLPPGGKFELPIGNADFIGFMDYLVPMGWMDKKSPYNIWVKMFRFLIYTISSIPITPKAMPFPVNFMNTSIGMN